MRDGGTGTADEGTGEHAPSERRLLYSIVRSVLLAMKDASGIGLDDTSGSERTRFRHPNPDDFGKTFLEKAWFRPFSRPLAGGEGDRRVRFAVPRPRNYGRIRSWPRVKSDSK